MSIHVVYPVIRWPDNLQIETEALGAGITPHFYQNLRDIPDDVWALADGEFWQVVGGEKFKAIDIDEKALEGEPRDFIQERRFSTTGICGVHTISGAGGSVTPGSSGPSQGTAALI